MFAKGVPRITHPFLHTSDILALRNRELSKIPGLLLRISSVSTRQIFTLYSHFGAVWSFVLTISDRTV